MYAAFWRFLPGPRWFRAAQCLGLALLLSWALLTFVFPSVEPLLPVDRIVISE